MSQPLVRLSGIKFRFNKQQDWVLNIPELVIAPGERVFVRGPSGCGKSTLLGLLAGIHLPEQGDISVLGYQLNQLSPAKRDRFRAEHIGYLFQQFNLLPYLSVLDNIKLSLSFSTERNQRALANGGVRGIEGEAHRLLDELGMPADARDRPVTELSIGQQQRVAAARALIGQPELVIADEPTSALDSDNRDAFIRLLLAECESRQQTLIFVSHDQALGKHFHRQLDLTDLNQTGEQATTAADVTC